MVPSRATMLQPTIPPTIPTIPTTMWPDREPRSSDVRLLLRQQPKEALVTTQGKEKARKPVDPPPIVQLHIGHHSDPAQNFLQSPYLFMCTSLYRCDKEEKISQNENKSLAGSLVSSLHRLKDVDNKDGGFFVFGDISIKAQGNFRLEFSLFNLRKDTHEVQFLSSCVSEPFKVLLPKDFKGMDESTYLSRAFSDQGVRLRLRKEPRAMMGNKRGYPYDGPVSNASLRPNPPDYTYEQSANKRHRGESDHALTVSRPDYPPPVSRPDYPPPVSRPDYAASYSENPPTIPRSTYAPPYSESTPTVSRPNYGTAYNDPTFWGGGMFWG